MSNTTPQSEKSVDRDVSSLVKDMLDDMESEFNEAGESILGRMNEMGKKLDDLERSISDLMTDAGLDNVQKDNSTSSQTTLPTSPAQKRVPQATVL